MLKSKENIPSEKGTYCLLFFVDCERDLKVGSLGNLNFKKGYYVYIGSAFGPGGLKARIGRHIKKSKKLRWHIDYLRKVTEIIDIKFATDTKRLECKWAANFAENGGITPFKGFGSSDCKCFSHLFYFESKPKFFKQLKIQNELMKLKGKVNWQGDLQKMRQDN